LPVLPARFDKAVRYGFATGDGFSVLFAVWAFHDDPVTVFEIGISAGAVDKGVAEHLIAFVGLFLAFEGAYDNEILRSSWTANIAWRAARRCWRGGVKGGPGDDGQKRHDGFDM